MIRIATRRAIAALLAALAVAGCAASPQPPPAAAADPAPQQALMALNKQARANYADSKREMLVRARPAIVVSFDDATLLRADAPAQTESFTPPLYHRYKEVAHLPLGLWSTLAPWVDRPEQTAWRAPLQALLERARAARATLEGVGFPPDRLGRQQQIFDRSIALMEATLAAGRPDRAALAAFAQAMAAPVLANGDDAAALQIDGLHAVVGSWRQALTPAQWRQLHVLVLGPKMPRADNLAMQYFERVMGRAERDRRLLYAEGIFDRDGALSLLGTVVTDRALAQAFFGDPMRMDRDFLSDGARKRLDRIFGRQAP